MRNSVRFVGYSIAAFGLVAAAAEGCTIQQGSTSTKSSGEGGSSVTTSAGPTTTGQGGQGGYGGSGATTTSTASGFGGSVPLSCNPDPENACTTCAGASCCNEITACNGDPTCAPIPNQFFDCRYDSPNEADLVNGESGYSTAYCKAATNPTNNAAANAVIDCFNTNCTGGVDANCMAPAETAPTFDNFAAKFIEDNCAGCHFQGFTAPSGQNLTVFNDDDTWFDWNAMHEDDPGGTPPPVPEGNPDWQSHLDNQYQAIIARKQIIYCGVQPDVLPDGCDPIVDDKGILPSDAFHNHVAKFPPSGMGQDHLMHNNPCKFAADANPPLIALGNQEGANGVLVATGTCPQPTHFDRARLVSWIVSGVPMD